MRSMVEGATSPLRGGQNREAISGGGPSGPVPGGKGRLPPNAARLVKQWTLAHQRELEENWRRARGHEPLNRIAGLDND